MSLNTAASIGLELLQHRGQIAQLLKGVGGLGRGLGQMLGGAGADKLGGQFQVQLKEALAAVNDPKTTNTLQAFKASQAFDTDRNGVVSKDELTSGLQQLEASGLSSQGAMAKTYATGKLLLQNYDKVAALDGQNDSISYRDLGRLVQRDGQPMMLSQADWQSLNA
jgi:hypothetical protein